MRNFIMPSLYHKILVCNVSWWHQIKFIILCRKKNLLNQEDEVSGQISRGREGEKLWFGKNPNKPQTSSLQAAGVKVQILVKQFSFLGTKMDSPALASALCCLYNHNFGVKLDCTLSQASGWVDRSFSGLRHLKMRILLSAIDQPSWPLPWCRKAIYYIIFCRGQTSIIV